MSKSKTQTTSYIVWLISGLTALSGLLILTQLAVVRHHPSTYLYTIAPFGSYAFNRTLRLAAGFSMLYFSFYLWHRRLTAWWIVLAASLLALLSHLRSTHHWASALIPLVVIVLLLIYRRQFRVKSSTDSLRLGLALASLAIVWAILFGTIGFLTLDEHDFGREYNLSQAIGASVRQTFLMGNPDPPQSRHARWFVDALDVVGLLALGFAGYSLFRPLRASLARTGEVERVRAIVDKEDVSPLEYFKIWPAKSYFFNPDRSAVVAYGVAADVALCFQDPVGEKTALPRLSQQFDDFCRDQGWLPAYLNAAPEAVDRYKDLGYRVIKAGELAMVDLAKFNSATSKNKHFRYVINRFDRDGFVFEQTAPEQEMEFYQKLRAVSDGWLTLPQRRERSFSLGYFDINYLRGCVIYTLKDNQGEIVAFANLVPSINRKEAAIDLMRHLPGAPNGTMDALFANIMLSLYEQGYKQFNLGLAALAGVDKLSDKTSEEWVMGQMFNNFNVIFSYRGLYQYKNKFEPDWQPRYIAYRGLPTDMLRLTRALTKLSQVGWIRQH